MRLPVLASADHARATCASSIGGRAMHPILIVCSCGCSNLPAPVTSPPLRAGPFLRTRYVSNMLLHALRNPGTLSESGATFADLAVPVVLKAYRRRKAVDGASNVGGFSARAVVLPCLARPADGRSRSMMGLSRYVAKGDATHWLY